MAQSKRKAITKKLRFEVFKRDNFTCQYCGAKSITKIGIGIEHRGQKDWVYAWSAEKGEMTHKPSWIK